MSNTGLNINDITEHLTDGGELEDQTVSTGGNFERRLLPIGKHPVRLVSYIELGMHKQPDYDKQKKPDAEMVALTFEFLGKRTTDLDDAGKMTYAMRKTVTLKKSFNDKAAFRKLFEKMRAGDSSIKNMAQMVGVGTWMMGVEWTQNNKVLRNATEVAEAEAAFKADSKNKSLKIWDNIRNGEGYMISPAVIQIQDQETGEITGTRPVKVIPNFGPLALFTWNNPKPMFWDSIHIEGHWENEVEGVKVKKSKNRWQDLCINATDYEGSALQGMLDGLDDLGKGQSADAKATDKDAEQSVGERNTSEDTRPFTDEEKAAIAASQEAQTNQEVVVEGDGSEDVDALFPA